jgi:hypothetical protein
VLFSAAYGQQALAWPRFLDGGDARTAGEIPDANGVQFLNAADRRFVAVALEDSSRMSANSV